ncbi:MAG: TPM domain-containing protein [Flavobacteriales bacterium]|nr:TPM domain-containing protein [Flavobacteriales bacterium]
MARLDTLFRGHEFRTTNETPCNHNFTTGQPDLRSFAATCGDSLGVGKKHKNNGVIIVFSKKLREVFIATGLGTEQVMADARCQGFIDSLMIPLFKEDMYFDGVWAGSCAIVNHLELPGNEIR